MTDIHDALDQIKARHQEVGRADSAEGTFALDQSQADVPRLVAAIEAVLEMHRPGWLEDEPTACFCIECQRAQLNGTYPCPTVRALTPEPRKEKAS